MVDKKMMYEEGTTVTLTATGNKVITFNNWQDGSTSSEYTLTMDADHTDIVAEFASDDYIAIWDHIRPGGSGRVADFYSADNDASTLVLINDKGETTGWLDKSEQAAGGYEGRPGAVNWRTSGLGEYAWQISFNAEAFTDIKIDAGMVYNYNAYKTYDVEFSIDKGENWTKVGSLTVEGAKKWTDGEFTLPAAANNQASVLVRFIADKTSDIDGTKSDNDGSCLGAVYVTGKVKLVDDGTAPVLESTVPAEGADNASINGKIILNFDEKVKVKEGVKATLGELELEPSVTGKVVTFAYKNLNYETAYTFTLPAGAVSDLTDNAYDKAITIKFETKARDKVAKAHYDRVVKTVDELVEAIQASGKREDSSVRFRIFIHNGTYVLPASTSATKTGSDGKTYADPTIYLTAPNVSFIGESRDGVIITNSVPKVEITGQWGPANVLEGIGNGDVISLQKTAVNNYFQHLTIKSAMGDSRGRDIEVNDASDKTIMKDVCLWGYQDTYVGSNDKGRFYFEGGVLRGRTDFLCGKGDVYYKGVTLRMCEDG
ncbi:MAG: Ig-like domain-containing protein, partial [Duncaniella sp.]|nr:Ig-like domain-containing protein [Duncaniella sp.]